MMAMANNVNDVHLNVYSFDAADVIYDALLNRFRYVSFINLPFDNSRDYKFFHFGDLGEFILRAYEATTFAKKPVSYNVLSSKEHEWCKMFQEVIYSNEIDFKFVKDSVQILKWCIEDEFPYTKQIDVEKIDHILNFWNDKASDEDLKFVGSPLSPFEMELIRKDLDDLSRSTSSGHHFHLLSELIKKYENFKR